MPTHATLGDYEIIGGPAFAPETSSYHFSPIQIDGSIVNRHVYGNSDQVTTDYLDCYAEFCAKLDEHVKAVRKRLVQDHNRLVMPLLEGLVEANGAEILDDVFYDEDSPLSTDDITPEMVLWATQPICLHGDASSTNVTIDIGFKYSEMNYLFACVLRLSDGSLRGIHIES